MARKVRYLLNSGELKRKDNSLVFIRKGGKDYIPINNVRETYCLSEAKTLSAPIVTLNSGTFNFTIGYRLGVFYV